MRDPPLATVVPRGRPAPERTPPCPLAAFGGAGGRGIRNGDIEERYHVSRCLLGATYHASLDYRDLSGLRAGGNIPMAVVACPVQGGGWRRGETPGGVTALLGDKWVPLAFPKAKVLSDPTESRWKIKPIFSQFPIQLKTLQVKGLPGSCLAGSPGPLRRDRQRRCSHPWCVPGKLTA